MSSLEAAAERYAAAASGAGDTVAALGASPLATLATAFKASASLRGDMAADAGLRAALLEAAAAGPPPVAALRLLRNLVAVNPQAAASALATTPQMTPLVASLASQADVQADAQADAQAQAQTSAAHAQRQPLGPAAATAAWQLLANIMAGAEEEGARADLFAKLEAPGVLDEALRPAGGSNTAGDAAAAAAAAAMCAGLIVYNFVLHEAEGMDHLLTASGPGYGRRILRRALLLMEQGGQEVAGAGDAAQFAWLLAERLCSGPRFAEAYQALGVLARDEDSRAQGDEAAGATSAAATVNVADEAPRATRETLESAEGVMARTALLKFIEARTSERAGGDRITLSAATVVYLLERCHLLAYLAQDEFWWRDPQQAARGIQLALIVRILANVAVHGAGPEMDAASVGKAAEQTKTITAITDLLREMLPWQQRATPAKSEASAKKDPTPLGFKSDLLRLAANLLHKSPANQKQLLDAEGVPVFLSCFLHDDQHPLMREWAVMAVRNLCEGNATAQAEIASYQKKPGTGTAAEGAAAGGAAADTGVTEVEREIDSMHIEIDEKTGMARPAADR